MSLSSLSKTAWVPEQQLPTVFALHPNYPNPFNPTTQLNYDLPAAGQVHLGVYDVLGRKVTELVNDHREAGYHSATWSGNEQASGIYFARFNVTDATGHVKYSKVNKLLL
ncbi:MAG: T9SS type A sorting domain-containing protein, partial [Bacteroidota bacterium]